MKNRTCTKCGEDFILRPGKPGLIHECLNCVKTDVPLHGGNMIWHHKTAPELELKPLAEARIFARKQKRFGAGVTCCLATSKETAYKELRGVSKFENPGDADIW